MARNLSTDLSRRRLVQSTAWVVPAAVVATQSPAAAQSRCVDDVSWRETVRLTPGDNNVHDRDKHVTDCSDVALDGWTKKEDGVSVPMFRAIIGSYIRLENVHVTVSVESGNLTLRTPSAPITPAGAATPCELRYPLSPLPEAVLQEQSNTITWPLGVIDGPGSAMFSFSGTPSASDPSSGAENDEWVVTIALTGTKECNDDFAGPCPTYPGAC